MRRLHRRGRDLVTATRETFRELEGSASIAMLFDDLDDVRRVADRREDEREAACIVVVGARCGRVERQRVSDARDFGVAESHDQAAGRRTKPDNWTM